MRIDNLTVAEIAVALWVLDLVNINLKPDEDGNTQLANTGAAAITLNKEAAENLQRAVEKLKATEV